MQLQAWLETRGAAWFSNERSGGMTAALSGAAERMAQDEGAGLVFISTQ